ncbi:MAG: ATP-binding cassette domain-containing protein [Anaerolineae bacterium]|nr:ATP-binding cassette domain-containing protein [Anaerolineae bacterium]
MMAYLNIQNLRVEYVRDVPTLDNFNLTVNEGELVALLGPSGCGKTTTLRSVAGFIEPAAEQSKSQRKITRLCRQTSVILAWYFRVTRCFRI